MSFQFDTTNFQSAMSKRPYAAEAVTHSIYAIYLNANKKEKIV
jgi:hypothetical protein